MKLTNNEISLAIQVINKLSGIDLPVKTAYGILKAVKALEPQAKIVEELRVKLVEKYAEEGEDGQKMVKPGTENFTKFIEDLNPILSEGIEIEVEQFELPDDMKISIQDLALIDKLVSK